MNSTLDRFHTYPPNYVQARIDRHNHAFRGSAALYSLREFPHYAELPVLAEVWAAIASHQFRVMSGRWEERDAETGIWLSSYADHVRAHIWDFLLFAVSIGQFASKRVNPTTIKALYYAGRRALLDLPRPDVLPQCLPHTYSTRLLVDMERRRYLCRQPTEAERQKGGQHE